MPSTDLSDDDFQNCYNLLKKFFFGFVINRNYFLFPDYRGGSRNFVTSKTELFITRVKGWKPFDIILKSYILDMKKFLSLSLQYVTLLRC